MYSQPGARRPEMSNQRAQIMPVWSPPFGTPPFPMLSAELLMVQFEADRAEIERITPTPLELPATTG